MPLTSDDLSTQPEVRNEAQEASWSVAIEKPQSVQLLYSPAPIPAEGEFLIRAVISGISAGTERMWFDGTASALRSGRRGYPYSPGYEFVGTVAAVGPNTPAPALGQRVFAMKPHGTHALIRSGDLWCTIPHQLQATDALSLALASTSVHALHRAAMAAGDVVAIVGLGVVGFVLLQAAKASGAMKVVVITSSQWKGDLATSLGADAILVSSEPDFAAAALEATRGRGFDVVFDCAGTASTMSTSTSIARPQGRVVVVGMVDDILPLSVEHLFTKELTVTGVRSTGNLLEESEVNRWNRWSNWEVAQHLVMSGKIRAAPLVTHTFPGSAVGEAYRLLSECRAERLQVVLRWDDLDAGSRDPESRVG